MYCHDNSNAMPLQLLVTEKNPTHSTLKHDDTRVTIDSHAYPVEEQLIQPRAALYRTPSLR